MAADPRDLTTVAAVRRMLQLDASRTAQDDLIQDLITEASVMLPGELGIEVVDVTEARTVPYSGNGIVDVAARGWVLRSVSAVSYADPDASLVSITSGRWSLRPAGGPTYDVVYLRDYGATAAPADATVTITGDWGFEDVPPDIERGVKVTVKTWLREGGSFNPDGDIVRFERVGRIPQDVLDGLSHYRRPVV